MKKITIYSLLIVSVSAWFLTACQDLIDVDLKSVEPQLVIEGVVRMGEHAEVLITMTKDFDASNEYLPVTNARVVVSDSEGRTETLQADASGRFVAATITGEERKSYYLSVTYDDMEYTSTSYMPPRVEIDSLTLWKLPVRDYPDPQVHFVDPEGEENQYYRYVLSINGTRPTLNNRLKDRLISTEFVDGNTIHQPIFVSFENDSNDDDPFKQDDVITVEMQCIDKGVYTFFDTLYDVEDAAANPTSNIKGGALGYFGAYSYTSKDIVMKWKE